MSNKVTYEANEVCPNEFDSEHRAIIVSKFKSDKEAIKYYEDNNVFLYWKVT